MHRNSLYYLSYFSSGDVFPEKLNAFHNAKKKTSVHDHGISVSHSFSNRKGMFNLSIFVEFKSLL